MKRKVIILMASVLTLAFIIVIAGSALVRKAKEQNREAEISIEEVKFLLSETEDSVSERFLQECDEIRMEKGYLPKEETVDRLIVFVNEVQPEISMGFCTLFIVADDNEKILAMKEGEEELGTYKLKDDKIDKNVLLPGTEVYALTTENVILSVEHTQETGVLLETVWIKGNTGRELTVQYAQKEFSLSNFDGKYSGYEDIADIEIKGGGIAAVKPYNDKVNARLLSVRDGKIELEGIGTFPYTEQIQVYKLFGEYEPYTLSDLKIGYDFTDFILNDDKEIVAALVSGEGYLDKIRVVIKTTDFESAYHEEVVLSCDTDMEWTSGSKTGYIEAGTDLCLDETSDMFEEARITFRPVAISARTQICSIDRSQGIPSYRGTIEVEKTEDGLLVINELPLDEYLYSVVPSEMPASYPLEALKAQAVSARTYAYAHMLDSRMHSYGAHVDDSAAFQVYNNIRENDMTTRAVRETEGVIVSRNGRPVTTYFYSTSCGYGTDLTAWMVENDDYLVSKKIGGGESLLLAKDDVFADYIRGRDDECYESQESYFRWCYRTEVDEENLLLNLQKRYEANPHQVLTETSGGYVQKEISEFGYLKEIEIVKRAEGGAVTELVLTGSRRTIKILSEKNVRYILAGGSTSLFLGEDYAKEGKANGMLPSAFLTIEPEYEMAETETADEEEKRVVSYTVWGGGFGHGIGMSQNGAKQMAKRGMTSEQILQFFYTDTDLEEMKREEE